METASLYILNYDREKCYGLVKPNCDSPAHQSVPPDYTVGYHVALVCGFHLVVLLVNDILIKSSSNYSMDVDLTHISVLRDAELERAR